MNSDSLHTVVLTAQPAGLPATAGTCPTHNHTPRERETDILTVREANKQTETPCRTHYCLQNMLMVSQTLPTQPFKRRSGTESPPNNPQRKKRDKTTPMI